MFKQHEWVKQPVTVDGGALVLGAPPAGFIGLQHVYPKGGEYKFVYYAIESGDDREFGVGVYEYGAGDTAPRITSRYVLKKLEGGVYTGEYGAELAALSGNAILTCPAISQSSVHFKASSPATPMNSGEHQLPLVSPLTGIDSLLDGSGQIVMPAGLTPDNGYTDWLCQLSMRVVFQSNPDAFYRAQFVASGVQIPQTSTLVDPDTSGISAADIAVSVVTAPIPVYPGMVFNAAAYHLSPDFDRTIASTVSVTLFR